jgi:hypothetical protein
LDVEEVGCVDAQTSETRSSEEKEKTIVSDFRKSGELMYAEGELPKSEALKRKEKKWWGRMMSPRVTWTFLGMPHATS